MSKTMREFTLDRRQVLGAAVAGAATLGLAACGEQPAAPRPPGPPREMPLGIRSPRFSTPSPMTS